MMANMTVNSVPVIKQGDEVWIPVDMYFNGEPITADVLLLLEEIEFTFDDQKPVRIPAAEAWNETMRCFMLPVTQEQTFALEDGSTHLDVRVQFYGGAVLGSREKIKMKVLDATSEEVL